MWNVSFKIFHDEISIQINSNFAIKTLQVYIIHILITYIGIDNNLSELLYLFPDYILYKYVTQQNLNFYNYDNI